MSSEGDSGATAECPSVPWRLLSQTTLIGVGALCRGFLFGLSNPEINGLDSFLGVLEERKDPTRRSRGLLTGGQLYLHAYPIAEEPMANYISLG